MARLAVQQLSKYFGERALFTDLSFEIGERDKIGLVGENGCGKTTLLRILMGQEPSDGGGVVRYRDTRIGYMEQHTCRQADRTLWDEVESVFAPVMAVESELSAVNAALAAGEPTAELLQRQHTLREQFEKTSRSRALQDPMAFIDDKRMLLDYTQKNLAALAQHQMAQRTQQFTALAAKLDALSPLKVLGRGYAVARNEQGQILRAAQEAAAGEKIEVLLGQGSLNCTVNACNMGGNDDGKNV